MPSFLKKSYVSHIFLSLSSGNTHGLKSGSAHISTSKLPSSAMALNAQNTNSAEDLQHQAQTSLNQKEYTKARYLFIQAYSLFSGQGNYNKAIDCGTQAAALYHKASLYKEAFDLCRGMMIGLCYIYLKNRISQNKRSKRK